MDMQKISNISRGVVQCGPHAGVVVEDGQGLARNALQEAAVVHANTSAGCVQEDGIGDKGIENGDVGYGSLLIKCDRAGGTFELF